MTATAARQNLSAWRNDDVYELPIRVIGADLTNLALAMDIRLGRDVPGPALVGLVKVTNGNAEGLRVAGVTVANGVPTSDLRVRINKSTLQALPYAGEIGDSALLEYALLIGGKTRLYGAFEVLAHAYGSDAAPINRVPGYGSSSTQVAASGGLTLTIGSDGCVELLIDGADLIGLSVLRAEAARDAVKPLFGTGAPAGDLGINGSVYYDTSDPAELVMYGPKTVAGWGQGRGLRGRPGAGGNVAIGRAQLKAVKANTGDSWWLSEGLRSGWFELMPPDFVIPVADPTEAVFIRTDDNRVFRRTEWRKGINIGWCGAKCDAVEVGQTATGTVDRAAVQAAIDLAWALKITDVLVPGPALIGEGFDTIGNVHNQLFIPASADVANEVTIRLKGKSPPPLSGGTKGGPALISTDTAGKGANVICSVVGCRYVNAPEGRSWTSLMVEDLIIRTPQNTPSSGVDARYMHSLEFTRARVDVFGGFGAGPNGVSLEQNRKAISYGVIGSYNNIPLWNTYDRTLIYGYNKGLFVGELTTIKSLCISGCETAAVLPQCQHPIVIDRLLILSCVRTFQVVGEHEVQCQSLDIEHTPLPSGWDARGFDIDSDKAYLRGNIEWHVHEAPFRLEVKSGADLNVDLRQRPPYQQSPNFAFSNIFPGFNNEASVSGQRRTLEFRSGRIPWNILGAARTGLFDAVGATVFCNFDIEKPDYRIAQVTALLHGATNSGQLAVGTMRNGTFKNHLALDSLGRAYFLTPPPAYADEAAAKAAGVPQNVVCERPDGTLFRQRLI